MTKDRPILFSGPMVQAILDGRKTQTRRVVKSNYRKDIPGEMLRDILTCPYGVPGSRLWVRETWIPTTKGDRVADYRATSEGREYAAPWKPSIHMPRWASRITLEVTGVRVERLQDISENDAMAEGIYPIADSLSNCNGARYYFQSLWDSIYADRGLSWDSNPWLWVVEFRRIDK